MRPYLLTVALLLLVACSRTGAGDGEHADLDASESTDTTVIGEDTRAPGDTSVPDVAPDVRSDVPRDATVDTSEPDARPRDTGRPDATPPPDVGPPDVGGFCGDGIVDPGEECDDGNNDPNDGCDVDCTFIDPAGGACRNDRDLELLSSGIRDQAIDCGLNCLADSEPRGCSQQCLRESTGLSRGCSGCVGDAIACAITVCLVECAADPNSRPCNQCQLENCSADFEACAGVPFEDL